MIDSREQLIHVLTEAAEVEHNLLCSYLYAAFSLKHAGEPGLTKRQGEAVERWRKTIMSVAVEEMAHLASVNNLLLAVGGAAHFNRPNLPVPAGYHPARLVIRLTPFDQATLDHFIHLERPEGDPSADNPEFAANAREREDATGFVTPSAINYDTIGELYDALADGFDRLSKRSGLVPLIDPTGCGQLGPDQARLPDVIRITRLPDALETIERIKEQGEGSSGSREDSHFDRFQTIRNEWSELLAADPAFGPAWPAASDPVMRRPLEDGGHVWITHSDAAAQLDLGNAVYGVTLGLLNQVFGQNRPGAQSELMQSAVTLMEVIGIIGNNLARIPADDRLPHVNAGFTFTVPRNLGFRPAYSRPQLRERLEELRSRAGLVFGGELRHAVQSRFLGCAAALLATESPTASADRIAG